MRPIAHSFRARIRSALSTLLFGSVSLAGLLVLSTYCSTKPPPAPSVNERSAALTPSNGAGKPNIIFFLVDDLSWNLVKHMPNVVQMQKEGMTFSHYYVTDSLCCPSRSSIFTGRYPHNTGVWANSGDGGGYQAFHSPTNDNPTHTFATSLRDAGYNSRMMGKYLNGYYPQANQSDPGWTRWDVAGDAYKEYNYFLNQDGDAGFYGDAGSDYLVNVMGDAAAPWVADAGGPFMLEFATFAPHAPYVPAPADIGTFDAGLPPNPAFNTPNTNPPAWLATWPHLDDATVDQINGFYDLRVEASNSVDRVIGALRKVLKDNHLDQNTYVVFSSDNGYHMGEHQLLPGKQTAFEHDINVPLIVVGPGVPANVTVDNIVENIDLCPTFAEIGGASAPDRVDGHSLLALLQGNTVPDWRNLALIEHLGASMGMADPDNEPLAQGSQAPTTYEAIRIRIPGSPNPNFVDSVFVHYYDQAQEIEFYDLTKDPHQRDNTAATALTPADVQQLQTKISQLKGCVGAQCWTLQHL